MINDEIQKLQAILEAVQLQPDFSETKAVLIICSTGQYADYLANKIGSQDAILHDHANKDIEVILWRLSTKEQRDKFFVTLGLGLDNPVEAENREMMEKAIEAIVESR